MIVRRLGPWAYLTRQPEHARQSAVITAHLREEFLGAAEDRWLLLRATARHDDGWVAWEADPRIGDDGLPVNFTEIDRTAHRTNWERTIFLALHTLGAQAAAIIARHAAPFLSEHDEESRQHHGELLAALATRAWPDVAEDERTRRLEAGFRPLFFGDALSLMALAGWEGPLPFELPRDGGEPLSLRAWRDGDWAVRVDPWPFALPALHGVHADAVVLPADGSVDARAVLAAPRDRLVRLPIDYLPGDPG